jgi:hypothetical protein
LRRIARWAADKRARPGIKQKKGVFCVNQRDDRQARADAQFQDFVVAMSAQRLFLTIAEGRAARAMLAEGFDFIEVAAFLQASPWAAFYRDCVKRHRLPESPAVRESLRASFDLRQSPEVAAERAIEALRRECDAVYGLDSPSEGRSRAPRASSVAFDIERLGRAHCREKNWPTWMRGLLGDEPSNGSTGG